MAISVLSFLYDVDEQLVFLLLTLTGGENSICNVFRVRQVRGANNHA